MLGFFSACIDCLCIDGHPCTPAMNVVRGLTFHLVILSVWMSGLYLFDCSMMTVVGNLSWQHYVIL